MGLSSYDEHDGLGLGEVTPAELVEEAIDRVERHNPALNAVVFKAYSDARAQAPQPKSGPFAGVPLLLKDSFGECAGMPTRRGSAIGPMRPATQDSEHVSRFRRAGFVPFGKTNIPEFGLVITCEPRL